MNRVILVVVFGVILSFSTLALKTNADEKAAAVQTEEKPVNVGNKICPVSGEKVGEMGEVITFEYNGKVYNMCCAMCAKDFKKDPEKYSKIADDEVAAAQKAGS